MIRIFLEMVIANSIKTSIPNYVIADISLSDFGRKEIKIAETEMPGLMAVSYTHLRAHETREDRGCRGVL